MKEDDLLLAVIDDKIDQAEDRYMITGSNFLDLRQRTLTDNHCRRRRGVRYGFYGGYEDAERCVAVFLPDYIELPEVKSRYGNSCDGAGANAGISAGTVRAGSFDFSAISAYFQENEEDDPLALIKISVPKGSRSLTHRDYLGSLLALGIKREMVGDILVRDDGADIIVLREMAEFIALNYDKAGRTSLTVNVSPICDLDLGEVKIEEKTDTVASLRLDNMISSVFGLSRAKAAEAIRGGIVFVNGIEALKVDRIVCEGDKLVFRGRGKAVFTEIGGQSRKDRTFVKFNVYR